MKESKTKGNGDNGKIKKKRVLILVLIIIFIILFPWLVIGARFNIIQKLFEFFEERFLKYNENGETTKKSGSFY